MRQNLGLRNLELDTYMSILIVTIVASFATFLIIHVAIDVPFQSFFLPSAYAIDSSL